VGLAFNFARPEVVGTFFDVAPADASDEGTADNGSLAKPGGAAELV